MMRGPYRWRSMLGGSLLGLLPLLVLAASQAGAAIGDARGYYVISPLELTLLLVGIGTLAAIVVSLILAILVNRSITRSVKKLTLHARAVGHGELDHHAEVEGMAEMRQLAHALNHMAADLKSTQAKLRDSEHNLRMATTAGKIGIWHWDLKHNEFYADDRAKAIYGVSPIAELTYDLFVQRLHPDDREAVEESISAAIAEDKEHEVEHRIILPDSSTRWLHTRGRAIRDETGKAVRLSGIVMDVTSRKQAQEELRESEEKFRRLAETTSDWVWEVDAQDRYTYCSPRVRDLLGYKPEEVIGKTPFDFMPAEEAQRVSRLYHEDCCSKGMPIKALENVNLHKDGRQIVLETSGMPFFGPDGKLQGYRGIDRDITERKRAEEALRQSEARFRAVFEGAPIGILTVDSQLRIINANPAIQRMLGYSLREMRSMTTDDITFEEDRSISGRLSKDLLAGSRDRFLIEKRYVHKNGQVIWARLAACLVGGPDAGGRFGIGVIEDISAFKRYERDLRRAAADLARSNRDLEQFAYVASHDLQEPLRMIFGHLQLIRDRLEGKLDAGTAECLAFAVDGAVRMQSMIRDLLTYSRLGTQSLAFKQIDAAAALQSAMVNLKPAIDEKSAAINTGQLPQVVADATQLVQLFQNLLGNALKYNRPEVRPEINVSARRGTDEWEFAVQDNGIGIKQEFHERIFQLFQRLHGGEKAGTGIGLSVCKRIVERHGGRIWVQSTPGEGSTFFFTIPDRQPTPDQPPSAKSK